MSKNQNQQQESSEEKAKKFVGGIVLEGIRKWAMAGAIGYLVIGGPLPTTTQQGLPRKEFETYAKVHKEWGDAVLIRLDDHLLSIDKKMGRMEERLDRALDKRLAIAVPGSITNVVARRP